MMKKRRWTEQEDKVLRSEYPATPISEISEKISRTVLAIRNRLVYLGLREPNKRHKKPAPGDVIAGVRILHKLGHQWVVECVGCGHQATYGLHQLYVRQLKHGCRKCYFKNKVSKTDKWTGKQFGTKIILSTYWKHGLRCYTTLCEACGKTCHPHNIHFVKVPCYCQHEMPSLSNHPLWRGRGNIPGSYISRAKRGAKYRGLLFDITLDDMVAQFEHQKGKCVFSGRDLYFRRMKNAQLEYGNASLDRKRSDEGYTKDNIQWIDKEFQDMKFDRNDEHFIQLCMEVVSCQMRKSEVEVVI